MLWVNNKYVSGTMPSVVETILENMRNNGRHIKEEKTKWRPIANFDSYMRIKKIADEKLAVASPDPEAMREYNRRNQERIIKLQESTPVRAPRAPKPPKFKYTDEFDRVKVDLSVSKNGKVRVKLVQPFVYLHDNYWSKGQCPPLKEYIINLKYAGYPDDYLEKFMKVHMDREKRKPEMEEFIVKVFGAGSSSKVSRVSTLKGKHNNNKKNS